MSTVPSKPVDRIQFYENHIAPWTTNAVAIGLTAPDVADIATKTAAARTAYDAYQVAKEQTADLYVQFTTAMGAMSSAGASVLKSIRGKAERVGGTSVYSLAVIPPPTTPESRGAPGTPRDFSVELTSTGGLLCKWKNSNATSATYQVYRRLGVTGPFTMFAGLGRKSFTDNTVPAGTAVVQYQIQAVRSSGVSAWALFNVSLGSSADGLPMVTESTSPVKIAA